MYYIYLIILMQKSKMLKRQLPQYKRYDKASDRWNIYIVWRFNSKPSHSGYEYGLKQMREYSKNLWRHSCMDNKQLLQYHKKTDCYFTPEVGT